MAKTDAKKTPRDVLRVIFRHVRLLLLAAAMFAILALLGATQLPEKYTGTAMFERRVDPAAEELRGGQSESFESRKLTLRHDLAGRHAIERAAADLDLLTGARFPRNPDGSLTPRAQRAKQELINGLQESLEVAWEVQSEQVDLVSVSFTHADPDLAREFPNTIVHNYITWVSDKIVERLRDSEQFLKGQVAQCQRRYEQANAERIEFVSKHAGMMPERPGGLEESIREIESRMDMLRRDKTLAEKKHARLVRLKEEIESVREQATTRPATRPAEESAPTTQPAGPTTRPSPEDLGEPSQIVWGRNPRLDELETELQAARDALSTMLEVHRMTDKHPKVQAQKRRIEQLEQQLAETPEQIQVETVYDRRKPAQPPRRMLPNIDLTVELADAQSEAENATRELERLAMQLENLRNLSQNFAPIRQEYEQLLAKAAEREAELKDWQKRYRGVQMALEAEEAKRRTHHESVLAAQQQYRPSSPSLIMLLGMAGVGGLGFGALLVLGVNYLDRSFRTPEEAERHLDIPVQGVIGEIVTPGGKVWRRVRAWVGWPIVSAIVLGTLGVCVLNIVLQLRYPDKHEDWARHPVQFVRSVVDGTQEASGP